jgi:hypothetical protein
MTSTAASILSTMESRTYFSYYISISTTGRIRA